MKRLAALFFVATILVSGCSQKAPKEDSAFFMGTFVQVTAFDPRAFSIVFDEFRRLEKVFNAFDETSELALLNKKGEIVASEDLYRVLKLSQDVNAATAGAFDVSVGPLSFLWKAAIRDKTLPAADAIADARRRVGMDYVYVDDATRRVKLLKDGVQLDLGAVAKGYALDRAVARLKAASITSALVNAGGSVYCLGDNNGKPWQVAIRDPRRKGRLFGRMELRDKAAATSGDYEQFFEIAGKRYSHIIDPHSGYPAQAGAVAATVVAPSAATADALATSCMVLDMSRCRDLLGRYPGVRAELIDDHGRLISL
ncbi:MAG: FAD:protein FMN transferase [Deltaproteobacteria bacterium]